jgi:hypothetical protein
MPPPTPAATLARAVNTLRQAANAAIHDDRRTWMLGNTLGTRTAVVLDDPDKPTVLIETYAERLERVNAYLTLVGPATGLAVADWLAHEASYQLHLDETGQDGVEDSSHALAVARAILGEAAE